MKEYATILFLFAKFKFLLFFISEILLIILYKQKIIINQSKIFKLNKKPKKYL